MNRNTKHLRAAEIRSARAHAKAFKALADESRAQIILMLSTGATNACDFMEQLNISQPTLSHHLKTLHEAGLVNCSKDGKWRIYSLTERGQRIAQFMKNG